MVNTYGYNRKSCEEDEAIFAAVKHHHDAVAAKGYLVVMTSLVGSQNYDLNDENSDVDTYSFIFPKLSDLALATEPETWQFEVEDGQCCVKDIRLAINLLRKASPNSVEYFTSKYKVYNPAFEDILKEYLEDNTKLWNMIHCDYCHMLNAIAGMAHQLTKRNMPSGKRFAHAIRLQDMYYHFMYSLNATATIELRMGGDRDLAMMAKRNTNPDDMVVYDEQCEEIAGRLENTKNAFVPTEEQLNTQQFGLALIDSFQWKLFKKYLMETNV